MASPSTVMIQAEVKRLLAAMEGKPALMARLIHGGLKVIFKYSDFLGKKGTARAVAKANEIFGWK